MERLHKIGSFTGSLACLALFLCAVAFAQDKCSLRVRVLSPNNLPVLATVSVRDNSARVSEKDYRGKDVEFCDLGILPVTVTISSRPGCNQLTIDDVFVSLNRTYLLKAIYDPKDCMPETVPPPEGVCEVLLQVQDGDGHYVPYASVTIVKPKEFHAKTDRFGRLLISGNIGISDRGAVSATGFDSQELNFTCSGYDPEEEVIKLKRH